jgi:hypothetical protein
MRHDVLIIWGHGLPDLDRVLDLVRSTQGFTIRRVLTRDIDDMPRFVRSVYNFDYAPYRHLIEKTRYLMSVPPRAAFIVLENHEPREHTVGKGRFAHTECERLTALKRSIRERYNPSVDGRPSEHHVVHGTDHAGQTLATLQLLGYRDIDELFETQRGTLPTPEHLPPRKQWTLREIDLDSVYARIAAKPGSELAHHTLPLTQTPHAQYVSGQTQDYEDYWQTHRGQRLQEDHAPAAFDRLIADFDYLGPSHPDSVLLLERIDGDRYVLLDGVHRAAILQHNGAQRIIAAIADETDAAPSASKTTPDPFDTPNAPPIDLPQLFAETEQHAYAVMKSLPNGEPELGSDIDILCEDKAALGRQLLRNARPFIAQGYALRVRELSDTDQTHIDLLRRDGAIALRLDLHEGLGAFRRTPMKSTFAQSVLTRRTWSPIDCGGKTLSLPVPDEVDDLVLRYVEYHEWFEARPDKIKHAEFIADRLADRPDLARAFYERLAQATHRRPSRAVMQYCDLNVKRQCVWAYWTLRDHVAWRIARLRELGVLALTEPSVFAAKLIHRVTPAPLRARFLTHKAQ